MQWWQYSYFPFSIEPNIVHSALTILMSVLSEQLQIPSGLVQVQKVPVPVSSVLVQVLLVQMPVDIG